jgi:hypothetical protein
MDPDQEDWRLKMKIKKKNMLRETRENTQMALISQFHVIV